MTRFLVVSDTHGRYDVLLRRLDFLSELGANAIIHLGDCTPDGEFLAKRLDLPLHAVAGNCDRFGCGYPALDVLETEGVRILLCHGHTLHVKSDTLNLLYAAQERQCSVALFGHTHEPFLETQSGVLLLNPGSLGIPRLTDPSIGLLTVDKGKAKGLLLPCKA